MRFIDEYRDPEAVRKYADEIARITTRPWTIMEICGGQTHSIVKNGIDRMLPDKITLLHGPGCPVCVTSMSMIDKAIALASRENIIFCSFGDMLRVPGSSMDLLSVKADGGDVRTVYSPLDAVRIAEKNPDTQVVFFAIGFETTAPANAAAVYQARRKGIDNFSMLVAQVLVPPAIETILSAPDCCVQGFLAAGHVCTVMGYTEYEPIAGKYRVPIVVTGFEPLDILQGIHMTVRQLEQGRAQVENQYSRAVKRTGNVPAQKLMADVFETVDREWRGIGLIPKSGSALRAGYREFDAEIRFEIAANDIEPASECISGLILQGKQKPSHCPAFGKRCTPEHPLGATMVSSEGACAAYYAYRRNAPSPVKCSSGKR
jgi:hydrogenase expression/formation protein HypD